MPATASSMPLSMRHIGGLRELRRRRPCSGTAPARTAPAGCASCSSPPRSRQGEAVGVARLSGCRPCRASGRAGPARWLTCSVPTGCSTKRRLRRVELAQRDQQVRPGRQNRPPVALLAEFGREHRHDGDRRQRRVAAVAPGEVDADADREEEERERRRAVGVPRRRPVERQVDADAVTRPRRTR